ncbi:MAG: hypothetical protein V3V10_09135 [Planctomycetota bacterium]
MKKLAMILASLAVTLAVTAGVFSQDKTDNWRTAKPTAAFLRNHLNAKTGMYNFEPTELLTELAARTDVTVNLNERRLKSIGSFTVVKAKTFPYTLFELTQLALGNRLVLVETGENQFITSEPLEVERHAPLVKLSDLEGKNPAEWLMVVVPVKHRRSMQTSVYRDYLTKGVGQITLSPSQTHVVIMDRVSLVTRLVELIESVTPDVFVPEVVVYQRRCTFSMASSLPSLQEFLKAWTRETNHDSLEVHLKWDPNAQVLSGLIPKPLASFLDNQVDATAEVLNRIQLEKEADRSEFSQFEVQLNEGQTAASVASKLTKLFKLEHNLSDFRVLPQAKPEERLIIRCRDWLEKDVKEAAELLQSK